MDYRIAIPSFERAPTLINKTFKLLKKHNITFDKVDLFLETKDMQDQYELYFDETDYGHINFRIIITDTIGIGAKRNFIRNYYRQEDTFCKYVLSIDDDIDDLCEMDKSMTSLQDFIETAFVETESLNLNIWGVSAFHNSFFMKQTISTNLKYVCGAFFGLIIDLDKPMLQTTYNHYEDFDFTIQHFHRDGGVVRFNDIALKTKYFAEGGINESYGGIDNRKKDMEVAGLRFVDQYRGIARLIEKKYGFDIRLNHRSKTKFILN